MKLARMKDIMLKYARYNLWANKKLLDLVTNHLPELLDKEIASSFNTIRKTFTHMTAAEYIWHCRLIHLPPDNIPAPNSPVERLEETGQKLIALIESKNEGYFEQATAYKNLKGESFTNNNFAILWHVFNHGAFHRGQIVSMLRNGGYTGPVEQTDFIAFERA